MSLSVPMGWEWELVADSGGVLHKSGSVRFRQFLCYPSPRDLAVVMTLFFLLADTEASTPLLMPAV